MALGAALSAVRGASKTCPAPMGRVGCAWVAVQSKKPDTTAPQNLKILCMSVDLVNVLLVILMKALSS
jgi:hypothetical protein